MADIIQLRRDNASNWSGVNPVLAQGEMGFDIDGLKAKLGNGSSSWNDLPYLVGFGASMAISAGSNSTDAGTVYLSNANGITFGMNSTGVITASHNGLTVQTGNFASTDHVHTIYPLNSLFAGTNISGTINATAFNLSVAAQSGNFLSTNADTAYVKNSLFSGTNISGTINSSAFALSVAAPPTILGAHAGTAFSGTNISGTINSTALQLSVAAPVVVSTLAVASTFTGTNITGTVNNSGWSLVGAVGTGFSGTNISGTVNGTGIALSVVASGNSTSFGSQSATPSQTSGASSVLANNGAWVTVATAQSGNFLSTNAASAYVLNSLFAGTNISGTVNSTAFNLSVAAPPTILAAHAGTAFSGTNISGTVNSTALQLSVAASGNSTSFGYQSATPSQTTGASSILANNGGWVTVVTAQTGNFLSTNADTAYAKNSLFAGTNISGTLNSTAFQLSVAAPPTILAAHAGTAFSGTNISGTINSTALQLSVAAPGGGGAAMALSASTSNVATGGTIFITGKNITIGMTTSTNGSHTMSLSGNAAGAGANLSNYVWPSDVFYGNIVTTLSTPISTNVTLRAMKVPSAIQFSKIEWPVSIAVASTSNNTASTQQLRHTVVIYSKNGASLSPIVGVAATNSYTVSSASTGSVVGPRWISAPLATTLTPGDYWVGIQAQTAGQQAMTLNHILVSAGSQMAAFLRDGQSITTANFASTGPFACFPLQGIIVASISNTTDTWNISQISVAPASYYRANMIFQFKDVTY